jgi:hypothetical protein
MQRIEFTGVVLKKKSIADIKDSGFQVAFGGNPAAGSPTATLLRLPPSHRPCRGTLPPFG